MSEKSGKVVLWVEGMMCQKNCGATVAAALRSVHGAMEVDVSFSKSAAYILVNLEKVPSMGHFVSLCIGAVEAVGFDCDRLQNQAPALVLQVLGMMCNNSCTPTVYNAIMSASPERIVHAEVSLDEQEAKVWGPVGEGGEEVSPRAIIDAIEASGFDANMKDNSGSSISSDNKSSNKAPTKAELASNKSEQKWDVNDSNSNYICAELSIVGMSCASCVRSVETGLMEMDGVRNVRIALLLEKGEILFDPAGLKNGADALKNKVEALGYRASVLSSRRHGEVAHRCVAYRVLGMSTAACATRIEGALTACSGVYKAKVDVSREVLFVHLDDDDGLGEGSDAGEATVPIQGGAYATIPGRCRGARDVIGLVALAGYSCSFLKDVAGDGSALDSSSNGGLFVGDDRDGDGGDVAARAEGDVDYQRWTRLLIISFALGVPTVLLHTLVTSSRVIRAAMMAPTAEAVCGEGLMLGQAIMLSLNMPLQLIVGARYYRQAYMSASHGNFGMDFLVSVGTSLTFAYSLVAMCVACGMGRPTVHIFFEASGMLLMFVTLGKWLESYSRSGTMSAISALLKLQPRTALLVGEEQKQLLLRRNRLSSSSSPSSSAHRLGLGLGLGQKDTHDHEEGHEEGEAAAAGGSTDSGDWPFTTPPAPAPATGSSGSGNSNGNGALASYGTARRRGVGDTLRASASVTARSRTDHSVTSSAAATDVRIELLQKGDVLKVLPGASVPSDGYVIAGSGFVDESMITGESKPVRKIPGDFVFGSTINTEAGMLYIRVTSLGKENALSQIVDLVQSAQMNKAPVQKYADRVAGVFTPIVMAFSLLTFLVWLTLCAAQVVPASWYKQDYGDSFLFALLFAISVIVISCPCALGLATPTAIMVGTAVGADLGLLIKGGPAFETAHKIDTVLFDKTGTLTEGKPEIAFEDLRPRGGGTAPLSHLSSEVARDALLLLAATVEQGSDHPLAQAVTRKAESRGLALSPLLNPEDSVTLPGMGITLTVTSVHSLLAGLNNTHPGIGEVLFNPRCPGIPESATLKQSSSASITISVGNRRLMQERQCAVAVDVDSELSSMESQGKTGVIVAINRQVCGVLGIADKIKSGSAACVSTLKSMGLDVWMVTGDNASAAQAVALSVGIPSDRVIASCMPNDKVKRLQALQAKGSFVAMVGDGINDSPGLACADLGVALGAGTQIAMEAADMILVRSNITDVAVCLDLAKMTFKRVRYNFLWALVYNMVAIPFAAGIFFPFTHTLVPPQYAGLSMALSSVSVVLNSSSLRFYSPPETLSGSNRGGGSGHGHGHAGPGPLYNGKRLLPTSERGAAALDLEAQGSGSYHDLDGSARSQDDGDDASYHYAKGGLVGLAVTSNPVHYKAVSKTGDLDTL